MRSILLSGGSRKRRSRFCSLPVLLALALFLFSLACYILFVLNSSAQAERIVRKLYGSEHRGELEEAARIGLPQMYGRHFAGDFTDAGLESLLTPGIPYTLYWLELGKPITRIHAQEPVITLKEKDDDAARYDYTVEVEFYLQRTLEKTAPVVKKTYTGTITLRRAGWLRWKMDAITTS